MWAIKSFRQFLWGVRFTVITDHHALVYLFQFKGKNQRLERWSLALQDYNFDIIHRPGANHQNVDALTRVATTGKEEVESAGNINMLTLEEPEQTLLAIQQEDKKGEIARFQQLDDSLSYFYKLAEKKDTRFKIDGYGRLMRLIGKDSYAIVVPSCERNGILELFHDDRLMGGHLGVIKTLQKISARYWWPNIIKDVQGWIRTCETCAGIKMTKPKSMGLLNPIPAEGPFQVVAMDWIGPLKTSRSGNKYILVLTDLYTKWVEAWATYDHTALTTASLFVEEFITRFGAPKKLLTDRGNHFVNNFFTEVNKLLKIEKVETAPYRPQTDGQTERFNRTLIQMLAAYTSRGQEDWDQHLPYVLFAYRTSVHATTGFSPFALVYGRDAICPWDTLESYRFSKLAPAPAEWMADIKSRLQQANEVATENIQKAQQKMKLQYDKNAKPMQVLDIGSLVWKLDEAAKPDYTKKLGPQYTGPFEVVEAKLNGNFCIKDGRDHFTKDGQIKDKRRIIEVHGSKLRPYLAVLPRASVEVGVQSLEGSEKILLGRNEAESQEELEEFRRYIESPTSDSKVRLGGEPKDKSEGRVQRKPARTYAEDWTLQDNSRVPNSLGESGGHSPAGPFESSGTMENISSGTKSCKKMMSTDIATELAAGRSVQAEEREREHAPKVHKYGTTGAVEEDEDENYLPRVGVEDNEEEDLSSYYGSSERNSEESDQLSPSRKYVGTSVYGTTQEIEVKGTYNRNWIPDSIEDQVMVQLPREKGKIRGMKTYFKVLWKGKYAESDKTWVEDREFYQLIDYKLPWNKWQAILAQLMGERVRKPRGPQVKKDVPEEEKEAKKIEKAKKRKSTAPKKKRTKSDSEEEYGTKKKSKTSKKKAKEESSDEEDEEYKSRYEDTEWPVKRRR